jgi:hypothetical protein
MGQVRRLSELVATTPIPHCAYTWRDHLVSHIGSWPQTAQLWRQQAFAVDGSDLVGAPHH